MWEGRASCLIPPELHPVIGLDRPPLRTAVRRRAHARSVASPPWRPGSIGARVDWGGRWVVGVDTTCGQSGRRCHHYPGCPLCHRRAPAAPPTSTAPAACARPRCHSRPTQVRGTHWYLRCRRWQRGPEQNTRWER